ncbi:MAG: PAS domain S-box protein [Pseudomonadota bacterium]|nr:PAS domain S-box protein [Pseudomonadota bacterium]
MLTWLGLRSRLVLLVLFALLPVMGLLAWSAVQSRHSAFELAESRLQSQVLLMAAHQQRRVETVSGVLKAIASSPSSKAALPAWCGQYLANLQAQHPELAELGLLGLDGRPACASAAPVSAPDLSQADFFKAVLAGQPFAVGDHGGHLAGIGFGVPVHDPLGQLGGVAYAVLGLQELGRSVESAVLLPGATALLLDHDATVLAAYPPLPAWLGQRHPDVALQQAVRQRLNGALAAPAVQAEPHIHALAPVPGGGAKGLMVAISLPHALVAAESRATLALQLAAMLAVLLSGMGMAWCMGSRLIVNPARAILKETHELGLGNLAARVRISPLYPNEIGQIGLALNRMAESLQAQRAELDAALRASDKERALLELTLNSMSDGVIAVDTASRFLLFNACAARLHEARPPLGSLLADWQRGHELLTLHDQTPYSLPERPLAQALRGSVLDSQVLLFRTPGRADRVLKMSARPLYDAQRQLIGGVAVFSDITERQAAEDFALAQKEVLGLIAAGASLPESLQAIVQLIEQSAPGSVCAILKAEDGQLRHGVAASLPASFFQVLAGGVPIAEGEGACGSAAFRQETVVVEDVATDPLMQDYRALLLAHGLHACWATPVLSSQGEVVACFAIYRHAPGRPQPRDLELIATALRLARIALARARTQAALVSSEARFRELAENIEDVFYNVDALTGRMRYISPGYEKLWGRSCASLYARPKSYAEAVLPEDRLVLTMADQLNAEGKVSDVQYRIVSADGQTHWIRDRSYPVFNAAGKLERVVGIARDVTERKHAKLALAATNRALQMLSRSCIVINRIEDEASLLAEVCRVAVEVGGYRMAWVGYARNDALKRVEPMAHAGDERGYLSDILISWSADHVSGHGPAGQAMRSGQPAQRSDIGADPTFYWQGAALQRGYRSSIALPLREGGQSFGVLCLYRGEAEFFSPDEVQLLQELADNLAFGIGSLRARLERRRSHEAARQAAAKLSEQAALLDHAQDAIIVRNLDRTVRFWNQGAQRLYGWRAQEALGQTMGTRLYRHPQVLDALMAQMLATGRDWTGELEQVARDGSTVFVESRCSVVRDEQGLVSGVLSINTDIGERRRAQEAILSLNASLEERVQRRTAQLELANQQLEAFSYSVSHDLRNPLSAIDGFSQLLQKTMDKAALTGPLAERSGHYLARIRAGVAQMGELIDAMLSLAQVSRSRLRWEAVDLSALAQGLLAGYQERDPGRPSRCQVAPGLLVQGDSRLLKQVLDNLLGNAWKFSAGQACTEITLAQEAGPDGEVVYVVRDNGAGFDMAYASRLFGAFERLHTQSEFAGTGIGLATVARIIERHGGRVWAESAPGQGARFYFTLGAQPG